MKKRGACIVVVLLMFMYFPLVFANSGPVYWQGYPSSDVMSIEKNSPIEVKKEDLSFDFSQSDNSFYSLRGEVTATYTMVNPTNEPQAAQMAFPYVGTLATLSADDIVITTDGDILPYELYLGDAVKSHGYDQPATFDFASIVNNISTKQYQSQHFTGNEVGTLYLIEVAPTTEQAINFTVDFTFEKEKSKLLSHRFNGYRREQKKTQLTAWCSNPQQLELFVLGEEIDFTCAAFTDGELTDRTDRFTYEVSTQKLPLTQYVLASVESNPHLLSAEFLSDIQLYNMYAKALDTNFTHNNGYCTKDDLYAEENNERVLTLVYTVHFPPQSEREVSVRYQAAGTMDQRKTVDPQHTFDYIINPAANWSNFTNLQITIITPSEAPYIINSTIALTPGVDNTYTASLPDLPKEDLSFTLYAHKKVTLGDKVRGYIQNTFGYFTPIILGFMAVTCLCVLLFIVRKRRKVDTRER
ncbi:MAG: hypothetical protein NUK65_05840 [Firmicutes bacterium]|nr:hypothetical protein [Bacillota bacterium]